MKLFGVSTKKMSRGITFAALVLISGCSFHSNQLEAVKRLLKPSEIVSQDHWLLSGPVSDKRVYPVQVSDAIIFTDGEDIFLKFDGWHFIEIRGVPLSDSGLVPDLHGTVVFNYTSTNVSESGSEKEKVFAQSSIRTGYGYGNVYEVNCTAWRQTSVVAGKLLLQSCVFGSQEAFSNSIWLDQSGNILAIESVLSPEGGKIRVAMRDL
jgi:hypothetical protein